MATTNLRLPHLEPKIVCITDPEIGRYITCVDIVDRQGRHWGSVATGWEHTMDREEQIARLWAAAGEMYEALEAWDEYMRACRLDAVTRDDERHVSDLYYRATKKLHDAYRKARGEAS